MIAIETPVAPAIVQASTAAGWGQAKARPFHLARRG